jgi:hypothetical protein
VPYLRQLGVNTIRVYSINPRSDHSACMNALDAAGIYVMLDVSLPLNGSIDRSAPAWTTSLLNEYTTAINAFERYPNVLAYTIANEVVTTNANTAAARESGRAGEQELFRVVIADRDMQEACLLTPSLCQGRRARRARVPPRHRLDAARVVCCDGRRCGV